MTRRWGAAALLAAALAAPLAAGGAARPDWAALNVQPYTAPKPAPAFALPDLDGRTVRLEALRGKVVLLFFWATW